MWFVEQLLVLFDFEKYTWANSVKMRIGSYIGGFATMDYTPIQLQFSSKSANGIFPEAYVYLYIYIYRCIQMLPCPKVGVCTSPSGQKWGFYDNCLTHQWNECHYITSRLPSLFLANPPGGSTGKHARNENVETAIVPKGSYCALCVTEKGKKRKKNNLSTEVRRPKRGRGMIT